MSNNFYNILKSFNKVAQEPAKPVQQQAKAKTKLEESIDVVSEKYMGFKKTEKAIAKSGAKDPAAVAASIGRKKYGKEKFQKAASAGKKMGEAADPIMPSKKAEPVKKKPMTPFGPKNKVEEKAPPGAKAERMVKHIKKGYANDGKLTPKEKSIAYATAWKAHNKGKLEETIKAMFAAGFTREQIAEGWEDMLKDVEKRSKEEKGTGKFDKKKTDTGTKYTRKYDSKSGESDDNGKDGEGKDKEKRGRGRPKKNTNESTATIDKMVSGLFESQHSMDYMALQKAKPIEPSREQGSSNPLKRAATNMAAKAVGGIGKAVRKGLDTLGHGDDDKMIADLRDKTFKEEEAEADVQESLNQMRRIAGLPVTETKAEKAKRDYDNDGKVETGKEEYLGSKIAAAKKAGKLKEGEMCSKCDCDPCECDDQDKDKVDECMASPMGGMAAEMEQQQGKMNINTNMSSDGNKSVTITADGDSALELMQMLKLAGMGGNGATEPEAVAVSTEPPEEVGTGNPGEPEGVAVVVGSEEAGEEVTDEGNDGNLANNAKPYDKVTRGDVVAGRLGKDEEGGEEQVEEDERYSANTTPKERVMPVQALTKGGDGDVAGREKKMTPRGYQFGDNPQAMRENASKLMREYESIKVKK